MDVEPGSNDVEDVVLDAAPTVASGHVWTRRALLSGGPRRLATGVAVSASAVALAACDPAPTSPAFHVLRRMTYGVSKASISLIGSVGQPAWLDEQLAPTGLDMAALNAKLAGFPALSMTVEQLKAAYPSPADAAVQLQMASFVRQVHSPAQVFERMVEFWSDHLNVPVSDQPWLKVVDDREVVRAHALGRFADLLLASARSPAMLVYLNNAVSFAGAYNENYGRELLELHTVGVDAGYTQADVVATARLLTGWTVDPQTGLFRFVEFLNDPAPLTIMGWTRPTTGSRYDHGVAFLAWLARHPATARRIARKLAVRFTGDAPDPALVDALAASYTANDTAIVPVLRTLVAHPAFLASAKKRFRRPVHQLVAVLRAAGADLVVSTAPADLQVIGGIADSLGQIPFNWPAPNGYPDAEGAWLTTGGLLARWNATGYVFSGLAQMRVDFAALTLGLAGKSPAAVVDGMAMTVVREPVPVATRDAIVTNIFGATPPATLTQQQVTTIAPAVATALACTPDFQYC